MNQFVLVTSDGLVWDTIHPTRQSATRHAEQKTDLPWAELYASGYRVRALSPGVAPRRRLVSLGTIDVPEDVLERLEMLSQRSGQTVRTLASLMIAHGLNRALTIGETSSDV